MHFSKGKKTTSFRFFLCLIFVLFFFTIISAGNFKSKYAYAETPPDWYRLRTNTIPYQPQEVTIDAAGGLWVTAVDGTEYEPSLWYHASTTTTGAFQYITNNRRNNYLEQGYNTLIEKPELNASILYATKDSQANTWYALKNRKVLCEKSDGSWQTFTMQNTEYLGGDTVNVDSAHRIRLIDNPTGDGQGKLLISARGIIHLDSNSNVVQARVVSSPYNNDFINDALIDSNGRYWVASNQGLEKGVNLLNTSYTWIEFPNNLSAPPKGEPITRIEEDSLGNIWFGSSAYGAAGIYCYTVNNQWVKYDLKQLLGTSNQVYSITAGKTGSVWVTPFHGGLLHFVPSEAGNGQWVQYTGTQLEVDNDGEGILSMAMAGDGFWFVTGYNPSVSGNGTGVHYLTFDENNHPQVTSYTYRKQSTTLTSNRINYIAADKSGGVWFPAYDDPSIARLKADGTWQQFRGTVGTQTLGTFGIAGVGVDSDNRVYFAPQNCQPVAYDVTNDQWIDLPDLTEDPPYYYGLTIDTNNGKWFYGSSGVYYMDPGNTTVTGFSSKTTTDAFADDYVGGVLIDDRGNGWFMTRYGLTLMKKNPTDGTVEWLKFTSQDASGYTGAYLVYIDDNGQIWNAAKQKFNSQSNSWISVTDTTDLDHRHLRFLNGRIPADMDMSGALPNASTSDPNMMTLDSHGNIFFSGGMGGLGSVNAGIVVRSPVKGDIDRNGLIQLSDVIQGLQIITGTATMGQSHTVDVNSDGQIGITEIFSILRLIKDN